ncbi:hypothetical protein Z517_07548 [Fonsecaea pedrosoi CBS 271.37]|uniref:Uncharacterized protein n=1 Tax=Fonsecaea pedrosoi CBS 271.37 TaxID=1442368 RepID=A0A0D2GGH8_9EURO|nr:uncharacterized protein Z517_07548 [Fonsecaea pedrosoi CBS 271.37]KIW77715.1 hypothetical protein Z517_07548 [Fonsecaea pedrosoi CBS 271.37]
MAKQSTVTKSATSKGVQFMSTKTPGNFQVTRERDRQEVRALAIRAASFSRPNRRKKKDRRTTSQKPRSCSDSVKETSAGNTRGDPPVSPVVTPEPYGLLGNGTSDPFDCMPVPITADSHDILTYVRSFTYAINWPDELEACREGGSLYRMHLVMYRKYFEHAAPLSGLLSYVYNLMAIAQPERANCYRQVSMQHSVHCFRGLRKLIDNLDYSYDQLLLILQTIWPLASAEYSESVRTGDDKCSQHRDALKKLIRLLGGLHSLPLVYRELIVHFFAKIAVVTGVCTEIDPLSWDPGPWSGQYNVSIPPQFDETRNVGGAGQTGDPQTLADIFAALRELVAVEEVKRRGTWSDEDHLSPIFRWSFLRRVALKMRLWNLWHSPADQLDTPPPPNTPRRSLDSSLCLAAQLFIYLSLEAHPIRQPWFSAPTQHAEMLEQIKAMDTVLLQRVKYLDATATIQVPSLERLANSEPTAHSQEQDLLWIVAVGACFEEEVRKQQGRSPTTDLTVMPTAITAVRAGQQGEKNQVEKNAVTTTPQTGWFFMHFGPLARKLGYTSFEQVRESFRTAHVYDAMMMDETLGKLFDMEA